VSPELEEGTAKEQYQVIMQEYQDQILPEWDTRTRQVQKVLGRLIPSSGLTGEKWEAHVIDDPQKNAFVLPG
jgi:predicted Zn-dependent protease